MEYQCSGCKKPFEDGEIVGFVDKMPYHHMLSDEIEDMKIDCTTRLIMNEGRKINIEPIGVFYNGNFLDLHKVLDNLNITRFSLELNEAETSHVMMEDLEKLTDKEILKI